MLRSAELRLRSYYRSRGFFKFKVDSTKVETVKSLANIKFFVSEGPRAVIGQLEIKADEDTAFLRKLIRPKLPMWYDEGKIKKWQAAFLNYYSDSGYPLADIKFETEWLVDDTMKVTLVVDKGPLVLLCGFDVEGLRKVRRIVVMREVDIPKCAKYSISQIFDVKRRIYTTGLFYYVSHEVRPVEMHGDTMKALLVFKVSEQKPGRINFALGYNTPDQLLLRGQISHNNLFNMNRKLMVRSEVRSNLINPRRKLIELEYSEPYFLGLKLEGHGLGYYCFDRDEQVRKIGVSMEMRYIIVKYLKLHGSFNWERFFQTPENMRGVVNFVELNPFWDSRDNLLNPRKGTFVSLRLVQAGGILKGLYDYRKVEFEVYQYSPWLQHVIAGRLRIWYEWPFANTKMMPPAERYTLGGYGSIRGYDQRSIGPKDPERPFHSGRFLVNFNAEARLRINKLLGLTLFFDAGDLWEDIRDVNLRELKCGAGVALNFYTPIVPFRLDWGIKLVDRGPNDRGRLYFGIGQMF